MSSNLSIVNIKSSLLIIYSIKLIIQRLECFLNEKYVEVRIFLGWYFPYKISIVKVKTIKSFHYSIITISKIISFLSLIDVLSKGMKRSWTWFYIRNIIFKTYMRK